RGLDLDRALAEVFHATPEELDQRFREFVDKQVGMLRIEPRWSAARLAKLQLDLATTPPKDPAQLERWVDATVSLACGRWQNGFQVDAEQALRRLDQAHAKSARACFLRGEMAIAAGNKPLARDFWNEGISLGGEDYRARFALGRLAQDEKDMEQAEQ